MLLALPIASILERNAGRLTYTLDDPYIHLALSEGIAAGHYGINPAEASSPSSSIVWPFLLALGARLPQHEILPLLLAAAAFFGTIALLGRLLERCELDRPPGGPIFAAGLLSLLVLSTNLAGLVLTGMEHSLQVLLAVAVLRCMIAVGRGAPTPVYSVVAIVAGLLVRYESAALSAAAILLLLLCRRWWAAGIGIAGCVLGIVGFSAFLTSLGLEPVPASVLASLGSGGAFGMPDLELILIRLKSVLWLYPAILLAVLTGCLVALAAASPRDARLLLAGAVAPALHLVFGRFGGFARYEIYVLTFAVALVVYGLRRPLRTIVRRRGAGLGLLVVGAVTVPALAPYAVVVYRSPRAAHNIYQQQHQMHRFVTDWYERPVAVNDLGQVAYRNPHYVLDLWGLTSAPVRRARLAGEPRWPDAFVRQQGIELAMIYDSWFEGRIPATWRRIARLHLRGQRITPSSSIVSFYLTRPGAGGGIAEQLRGFRETLPADVELELELPFSEAEPKGRSPGAEAAR